MTRLTCQKCKLSGPVISDRHKNFRQCGFDHTGLFTENNYCCETLSKLREWAHHFDLPVFKDDHWTLRLLINDVDRWVIHWYKHRGATMYMSINGFPATLENVEKHFPSMLINMTSCDNMKQGDGNTYWIVDHDAMSVKYGAS